MPKKSKTASFKKPRHRFIIHPKKGIIPIELYGDIKEMMQYKPKPTLHAKGGLIKGKPKLARKGF